MYLLRRTAARAISAAPSKTLFVKPAARNITTYTPAFQTSRLSVSTFQRRFASDDVKIVKEEAAATEAAEFAQTASETAPIEENVTPAQEQTETSAAAPVTADALEGVARESQRNERPTGDRTRVPRERGPAPPPNKTLYVGNLYYEVTGDQLQRIFSRFGEVTNVKVVMDNRGLSRGFALVDFADIESATAAIQNLDQQVFEGRNLIVQYHRVKPARQNAPRDYSKPQAPPSKTLFIGNMSFQMTDKDLNDLFRDIRNVVDVRVAIDRRTGQPRGFAHADFIDTASAVKALELLQGKTFHGRELRLDYSQSANNGQRRQEGPPRTESSDPFQEQQ